LDENAHAYCLEVNVLPSMETTTLFDQKLKFPLLQNTFEIVQPTIIIDRDTIVIPESMEHEPAKYSFSKETLVREDIIDWDTLTHTE